MRPTVRRGTGCGQQPHCPAPRRGSSWRMAAAVMVCGGDQPSHKVLEVSTGMKEVWSLRCGHQDEAWGV